MPRGRGIIPSTADRGIGSKQLLVADMKKKSLERRLYDAWRNANGIHLNVKDIVALLGDDAMQTRITNALAVESGFNELGAADPSLWSCNGSVRKFIGRLKASN